MTAPRREVLACRGALVYSTLMELNDSSSNGGFPYNRRLFLNMGAILLGDALALLAAILLAGLLRYVLRESHIPPSRALCLIPLWFAGAVIFRIAPSWGLGPIEELRRIQVLLLVIFGMAAAAMFLTKTGDITSRIKFSLMYLISVPLIPFTRTLVKKMLLKRKCWGMPTAIYGNDRTVSHVLDVITKEAGLGYIPIGIFDDDLKDGDSVRGIPVLGGLESSTRDASFAILGAPSIARERLMMLLEGPLSHYRRVIIIPDLLDIPSLWVSARDFMGVLGLEVERNLLNPVARLSKQLAELVIVLMLSPLWIPVCLLLALAIRLQTGAGPLFRQERVGRHGKLFKTWKFRTMVPNAEEVLEKEMTEKPELREEWNSHYKLKNDPRITPIGRFLRRSSLDELPQLVNVLRGEMSLVGPRPLPKYHQQQLSKQVCALRESVLPGITGLWQVSGRSESGTEGMERWDTYYVRNWSIWLDIVILFRTFRALLTREGAY